MLQQSASETIKDTSAFYWILLLLFVVLLGSLITGLPVGRSLTTGTRPGSLSWIDRAHVLNRASGSRRVRVWCAAAVCGDNKLAPVFLSMSKFTQHQGVPLRVCARARVCVCMLTFTPLFVCLRT